MRLHAVRRDNSNFHFHADTNTHTHTYSRITSTKSSSFCMMTFSASLTNLMVLLPQSRDCICHTSRWILAPPPLKHTDLRAYDFAQSPDLWHQPTLQKVTYICSWRLCVITPAIPLLHFYVTSYIVYKWLIASNSVVRCFSIQNPVVVRNRSRSSYVVSVL